MSTNNFVCWCERCDIRSQLVDRDRIRVSIRKNVNVEFTRIYKKNTHMNRNFMKKAYSSTISTKYTHMTECIQNGIVSDERTSKQSIGYWSSPVNHRHNKLWFCDQTHNVWPFVRIELGATWAHTNTHTHNKIRHVQVILHMCCTCAILLRSQVANRTWAIVIHSACWHFA